VAITDDFRIYAENWGEIIPKCGGQLIGYFNLAAELQSLVEEIDGFISIERFQSLVNQEKYLSLSFWRDEEGICN